MLLAIARGAIEKQLLQESRSQTSTLPWLQQAGATFVTLTKDGELRGCIGSLEAARAARRRRRARTRSARRSAIRAFRR